jgi:hypothetical protein
MKKILAVIFGLLFYACGGKEAENTADSYADISIQADTVVVDSGDEILMAATNGFGHGHTSNLDKLYNWDYASSQIEVVDLRALRLLEKQSFEIEGPDGVGKDSYMMKMIGDNQLAFVSWNSGITITDLEGKVAQRIKLDQPWMTEGLEEKGTLSLMGFSGDGKKMYCTFMNFKKLQSDILELDLDTKTKRVLQLPEFEKLDKFRIAFSSDDGNMMSMSAPSISLSLWQDQLLFYTNALNSVYRLDPKTDSLHFINYNNQLTANEKTGSYQNEVSSNEEMQRISTLLREEVNFSRMIWDNQNEVFYRFTNFNLPKTADEEIKVRSFISILSSEFKFLGEKEITYLGIKYPNPQFAKDGKVWLFLNLEDELAYVRLSVN